MPYPGRGVAVPGGRLIPWGSLPRTGDADEVTMRGWMLAVLVAAVGCGGGGDPSDAGVMYLDVHYPGTPTPPCQDAASPCRGFHAGGQSGVFCDPRDNHCHAQCTCAAGGGTCYDSDCP